MKPATLAGAARFGPQMTCAPTELLRKKSLHISSRVDRFASAGGIVNFVHSEHGWAAHPGGVGIVGGSVWNSDGHFGMVLKVTYAMLSEHGELGQEVEGAVGFAYRL